MPKLRELASVTEPPSQYYRSQLWNNAFHAVDRKMVLKIRMSWWLAIQRHDTES